MNLLATLVIASVLLASGAHAAGNVVYQTASAAQGAEGSERGLGERRCGTARVTVHGAKGTVGAARCHTWAAVCITDDTGTCTAASVINEDLGGNKFPVCWVGATQAGAGFAECEWDSRTSPSAD